MKPTTDRPSPVANDNSSRVKTPSIVSSKRGAKLPSGKQRLLQAAERLFSQHGFLEVSAAQIVKEAGVAHGLLFHHFGSMDELYREVTRLSAEKMDAAQLQSFHGETARLQVKSFLMAHMTAVEQRKGDAIFRARALNSNANNGAVAQIWEASRYRAIHRLLEVLGIPNPTKKMQLCLRAWIGFHDQLVTGWLTEKTLTQEEVLDWSLRQLDQLAADILGVDLDRAARSPSLPTSSGSST